MKERLSSTDRIMDYKESPRAKLFMSIIFREEVYYIKALKSLIKKYGKLDFESEIMPFNWTTYYNKEMGEGLLRKFISFKKLIFMEELKKIKLNTIKLERKLLENNKRRVNIDPGIITLNNFVLATTKGYTHRIYLGNGIYGDLTLIYKSNGFKPLEWTYPDYKDEKTLNLLFNLREDLKKTLRIEKK